MSYLSVPSVGSGRTSTRHSFPRPPYQNGCESHIPCILILPLGCSDAIDELEGRRGIPASRSSTTISAYFCRPIIPHTSSDNFPPTSSVDAPDKYVIGAFKYTLNMIEGGNVFPPNLKRSRALNTGSRRSSASPGDIRFKISYVTHCSALQTAIFRNEN